jgi:nucleoside-diphosphate-sugar epimerase
MSKPNWIIAGGMGMIGRNLVKYLIDNNLVNSIRILDKRMPFMAFLNAEHKESIENPIVECVQCDLSDDSFLEKAYVDSNQGGSWDVLVNLAAETSIGKKDEFYEKMVSISKNLLTLAKELQIIKFIHISTAFLYKSNTSNVPSNETSAINPWTTQATYSQKAEQLLLDAQRTSSLPLIILRPAIVYGPGDVLGLMPRAICAASYVKMKAKMEFLWSADLKMNTVHVFDVARAIYFVSKKAAQYPALYNLTDKSNTTQGMVSTMLGSIFSIETGFAGSMMSNLASIKLDSVVDGANEQHLAPWLALLRENKITNTPLSPFLHKQLLGNNYLFVDGTKIENELGFKYAVPNITKELIQQVIEQHIAQGIFPNILGK